MTPLRRLLWFDCTAAAVVGVLMLALAGTLAPVFGVTRDLLIGTAIANLVYGAFSFSLARRAEPPRSLVRVLVVANFAWTIVCIVLAATIGARLGAAYLLAEGIFVAVLAAAELRASRPS